MREPIDLREALNAISDVVQNRPRALREFDQIYMKSGDMVLQSEFVASWANSHKQDGDRSLTGRRFLGHRGFRRQWPAGGDRASSRKLPCSPV